ncbi:MAG: hypothetical protein ABIA21_00515 [Candidatus Aenigmatarchaeota archaeon]
MSQPAYREEMEKRTSLSISTVENLFGGGYDLFGVSKETRCRPMEVIDLLRDSKTLDYKKYLRILVDRMSKEPDHQTMDGRANFDDIAHTLGYPSIVLLGRDLRPDPTPRRYMVLFRHG